MTDADITAKLEKPGAGLPLAESLVLRFWVGPVMSKKASWEENWRRFDKTTASLLKLVDPLDETQLTTKVLVPSQRGLEDSSRYWSAAMLLEHLVIVGQQVKGGVLALSRDVIPKGKASVAAVKPPGQMTGAEAVALYKNFASTLKADIDTGVKDKDSKAKFRHPWLGPLTCRQWQWLFAAHQSIHLHQLHEIVKRLPARQ